MTGPVDSRTSNRAATFRPVRLPRVARPLAALLLLLLALASPGAALAHGLAHHHLLDEHADHHGTREHGHERAGASVPDHGHEHQHPSVDQATRARTELPLVLALPVPALSIELRIAPRAAAPTSRALLPRGDPHSGPPPNPRAPPLR